MVKYSFLWKVSLFGLFIWELVWWKQRQPFRKENDHVRLHQCDRCGAKIQGYSFDWLSVGMVCVVLKGNAR